MPQQNKSTDQSELAKLRFRDLLLNAIEPLAHIGHYEWNYDLDRLESCSEVYARLFDMSIAEVIESQSSWHKTLQQIHPDDRDRYAQTVEKFSNENSLDVRYRILRENGDIRHIREVSVNIADGDGQISRNFGILQDITEQVNYEQMLEFRDGLWQQAEAITEIGHFNFDLRSGVYRYISPGFARIHGVGIDDYLEKVKTREDDIMDVHGDDYQRLQAVYRRHAASGDEFNVEYRITRPDGEIRWIREQATTVRDAAGGMSNSIGVLQDITGQKQTEQNLREARDSLEAQVKDRTRELAETIRRLEEEMEEREKVSAELNFLANHDALTGLPSLRLCKDRLDRSLAEARRNQQKSAVMFLDLDGFKDINDSYGHEFGDLVLKVTADRIRGEIRETDTVARIGGDEFVIILSRLPQPGVVEKIASSLIEQISQAIHFVQYEVSVSASIGIALYPDHGGSSEDLIRIADKAMYAVKKSGKNDFLFYQPGKA